MPVAPFAMQLLGPFRLLVDGVRIDVTSRRGQALLAMLATSPSHERTRAWLQDRLWGTRGAAQGQASLRRELSSLRKLINRPGQELLCADHLRIWLDPALYSCDLGGGQGSDLLEGLDLPGEEGFEDWLRRERRQQGPSAPPPVAAAPALSIGDNGLAALHLTPISGSAEMTDALAERLGRIRWLQLHLQPGGAARYSLAGQWRGAEGGPGTLSLSLTETGSGRLVWSGRFADADPAAPPPAVIDEAICAVRARIAQTEQARCHALGPAAGDVAALVWQSQWHMHRMNRADAALAGALARQALDLDSTCGEAIAQHTWVRLWDLWVTRAREADVRAVREQAQRAIIADHEDARGHMLAGIAEIWLMQPLRAEALLRRAVDLDPSLVMARVQLACALYHRLMLPEAEAELETAMRLSPNDQYLFFIAGELATTCLMQEKWDEALLHAETALAARRSYVHGHVAKVNALVHLGRMPDAAAAHHDLYRATPHYSPSFIDWIPFLDSSWHAFFKDGLNRAAAAAD